MAGMDGFETCVEIRQIAGTLPIVMLTSDALPGDVSRRRETGLSGYAVKPVKRSDLLRVVCEAMKSSDGLELPVFGNMKAEIGPAIKILLAEDSPDNRFLLQAYMKGSRHQLTLAENGKIAVDRFAVEDFDLILMDIQMPVMDGLTATREIRAIERERGVASIPIVALTAHARPQDVELSRNAGCNDHLPKPISKRKLWSVIEKCQPRGRGRPSRPVLTAASRSSSPGPAGART